MRVPKGDMWWACRGGRNCYIEHGALRLSVFRGCFPRGCNFGDIDGIVEIDDHFLLLEWKRPGQDLPIAQRKTIERFTEKYYKSAAIIAWGDPMTMRVKEWQIVRDGVFGEIRKSGLNDLKVYLKHWSGMDRRR